MHGFAREGEACLAPTAICVNVGSGRPARPDALTPLELRRSRACNLQREDGFWVTSMKTKVLQAVARLRAARLAEVSRKVRVESMRVNAEFAAVEQDPEAKSRRGQLPRRPLGAKPN